MPVPRRYCSQADAGPERMNETAETDQAVAREATWTFERNGERLLIHRDALEGSAFQLIITADGTARTVTFTDIRPLVIFQQDMEAFLIRTGWSLAAFSPDRRTGADRRGFPRVDPDRRRWWTDIWRQSPKK